MFKSFVRTIGLTCLAGVVSLATEAQGAATVSLKAVAKNGTPIAKTNAVSVARGDTITAEVYLSGWSNPPFDGNSGLVQTYQARILGAAGALGNGGNPNDLATLVLPSGWVAPLTRDTCPCNVPGPFPYCDALYGCVLASTCVGGTNPGTECIQATGQCQGGGTCNAANHFPANMSSINGNRSDFIFLGFDNIRAVDNSTLNVGFGATINGSDGQFSSRCAAGGNIGGACSSNAECPGSTCDANFLSYAGTLNLKVGLQACGTYTFNFSDAVTDTFIYDPSPVPVPVVPAREGLTITVTANPTCPPQPGACCNEGTGVCADNVTQLNCTGRWGGPFTTCATLLPECVAATGACCIDATGVCTDNVTQANCTGRYGGNNSTCVTLIPPCTVPISIVGVSPDHCAIDARRPFPPNTPAQRQGFNSMVLTFSSTPGTGEDAANDYQVTQIPAQTPPVPPIISSVVAGPGANQKTLNFNVPIQPNKWTCVRHIASNSRRCIGFLPADANSNRAALPNDILDIIDNLNGVRNPPLVIHQCDIDRSGICAPADILTEIDLLNGTNGFPVQNGKTLEACPSTTP